MTEPEKKGRKAKHAQKAEKQRYIDIIEGTNVGTWEWNVQTGETIFNERWAEIIGYTLEELSPVSIETWTKYAHPDDLADSNDLLQKHFDGQLPFYEIECRMRHKNGSWVWVFDRGKVTEWDENGKPLWMCGAHQEITERKKTELALKESTAFNEMLLNASPDVIYIYDIVEKRNVYSNEGIARVIGYTVEEVQEMGENLIPSLMHPDDLKVYLNRVLLKYQEAKDNEWIVHDFRMKHKDGDWRWLHAKETIFKRLKNGDPMHIFGVVSDITREKIVNARLQDALKRVEENEHRFNELFQNMNNGCAIYRAVENGNDFIFVDFNKSGERIEKTNKNDILGKKVTDVFPGVIEFGLHDILKKVYKTGKAEHFPIGFYRDDKIEGWRDNYVYKLKNGDVVAIYYDRTKEKQDELELIQAKEKAEESNRLKTEFLNNMSHEIRTPMNGIMGFAEFLDKPDISPEKQRYYTRIIQNSATQLLHVIDDILEISALTTKQVAISEDTFCLNDLLMDLFSIFNLKAQERKIPIYLKKGLPDKHYFVTDKTKLTKILMNLIENAIKFTLSGYIELGYTCDDKELQIYVKDTGIGIEPKNQKLIFERFSQEEKEISRKLGGLGLGLSIAKENAELIGGSINLESEKGKGSTFYLKIPCKTKILSDDSNKSSGMAEVGIPPAFTILVAEDEEVNFLYIEILLKNIFEHKINIIHARNGREAVDLCKENSAIDLVLMDIKMPVMDGHEATHIIKKHRPSLPVIAQTAYSTEANIQKALDSGCSEVITKPIDRLKIEEILSKFIEKKYP